MNRNEIYFKVHETQMLIGLIVHQDGVKHANFQE
jgi:hypothetical protein